MVGVILVESGFKSGNRSTRWQELSFAIVGLGLIGGSYAKALRKLRHPSRSKKLKDFLN